MAKNKDLVLAQLKLMDSVPITAKEIQGLLGIDPRTMRDITHQLRTECVKVCSGDKGYWLWDGEDGSLNRTIARLKSQRKRIDEAIKGLESAPLDGQQEITLKEREETWREALREL